MLLGCAGCSFPGRSWLGQVTLPLNRHFHEVASRSVIAAYLGQLQRPVIVGRGCGRPDRNLGIGCCPPGRESLATQEGEEEDKERRQKEKTRTIGRSRDLCAALSAIEMVSDFISD